MGNAGKAETADHSDPVKAEAEGDLLGKTAMDPTEIGSGEESGVDRKG